MFLQFYVNFSKFSEIWLETVHAVNKNNPKNIRFFSLKYTPEFLFPKKL